MIWELLEEPLTRFIAATEVRHDFKTPCCRLPKLVHSTGDLETWLNSVKQGRCHQPVGALCGVCDRIHGDRDCDGELFPNCVRCQAELVEVFVETQSLGDGGAVRPRRSLAGCDLGGKSKSDTPSGFDEHPRPKGEKASDEHR